MSSVWKRRYKKETAKRSAQASGTTISALRREKEQRREGRLKAWQEAGVDAAAPFIAAKYGQKEKLNNEQGNRAPPRPRSRLRGQARSGKQTGRCHTMRDLYAPLPDQASSALLLGMQGSRKGEMEMRRASGTSINWALARVRPPLSVGVSTQPAWLR
jgi:hypothetical protein